MFPSSSTSSAAFAPLATHDPSSKDDLPFTTAPKKSPAYWTTPSDSSSSYSALADRIQVLVEVTSSRLGPILLVIASVLLSLTIYCYFAVFIPFHYQWPEGTGPGENLGYLSTMVWSLYLVWGILANYYFAVQTPPGTVMDGVSSDNQEASFQDVLLEMESFTRFPPTCRQCHLPKPERTHHCSICKKCILKYDHHCPWINNCVGHFNHRYFVMFLTYLTMACVYFLYMGIGPFMLLVELNANNMEWPYPLPQALVAFSEVLAVIMGLAVGGMGSWHWYLTLTAQTTLEQYNNNLIKDICKRKGDVFSNMYDFGIFGNLLNFFNVGPRGHYPWYTVLLPIRIPPIGNGKKFEKSSRGFVLDFGQDADEIV
ncbi:hypothetical protein EMPS_04699 [Entomortierella parvispora]|uniref:Palmitoyltransferase n=1 Tax=Entomortierella parvispora TaxID=205924 RepID=A0A9P3H936_9FUNG|nr:hypothetical protein EMPS_04699 [Entomortierella parvispora]